MSNPKIDDDDQMDIDLSHANAANTGDVVDDADKDALLQSLDDKSDKEYGGSGKNIEEDSDSDTDSDNDDDTDALTTKYQELLKEIFTNKYNYDNYVALVDTAHTICDLDKIRESCELFNTIFPLAPEIWLRWLRVELNIATTENELKRVHQLFKRAFSDYFSSDVALEYANLATKLPNPQSIWDEITSTYALDCMKGKQLFDAWRTYYINNQEESADKTKKLIEMFEHELSLPLCDIEETYIEFKALCEKNKEQYADVDWKRMDEKYARSKKYLFKMLPFEQKLFSIDSKHHQERAAVYLKYIEECKPFMEEQMVQVLYERMVTVCCLDATCWLKYIKYLQKREASANSTEGEKPPVFCQTDWDIVNRALRNCTWSAALYIEKMYIAEQMELPKQEVTNIVEEAFEATSTHAESYLGIWLEYLAYLKRNVNYSNEEDVQILRKNMELGWDSLASRYADPYSDLEKLCARIEYGPLQNGAEGKKFWKAVMKNPVNLTKSVLWIEFAHLELIKGVDAARKVFRKAVKVKNMDDIHKVISSWKSFELANGTLDQLRACREESQQVTDDYVNSYKKMNTRSNTANSETPAKQPNDRKRKNESPEKSKKNPKSSTQQRKEHTTSVVKKISKLAVLSKPKMEKRRKVDNSEAPDKYKDETAVFLSNLSYDITSDEIIATFPELNVKSVNIVRSLNGRSRGFGYIQVSNTAEVELALTFDRRTIGSRPCYISSVVRNKEKRGKFKYSEDVETKKVFVRGLPFDATKEELEQLFTEFGAIKDIRMVCHKNGAFKGIAYIQYEEESSASKAVLVMDQFILRNLTLSVAISAPPSKAKASASISSDNSIGLGQGRRSNVAKGDQKPRLSFIPRSVQKTFFEKSTSTLTKLDATQKIPVSSKSNDDFRKYL